MTVDPDGLRHKARDPRLQVAVVDRNRCCKGTVFIVIFVNGKAPVHKAHMRYRGYHVSVNCYDRILSDFDIYRGLRLVAGVHLPDDLDKRPNFCRIKIISVCTKRCTYCSKYQFPTLNVIQLDHRRDLEEESAVVESPKNIWKCRISSEESSAGEGGSKPPKLGAHPADRKKKLQSTSARSSTATYQPFQFGWRSDKESPKREPYHQRADKKKELQSTSTKQQDRFVLEMPPISPVLDQGPPPPPPSPSIADYFPLCKRNAYVSPSRLDDHPASISLLHDPEVLDDHPASISLLHDPEASGSSRDLPFIFNLRSDQEACADDSDTRRIIPQSPDLFSDEEIDKPDLFDDDEINKADLETQKRYQFTTDPFDDDEIWRADLETHQKEKSTTDLFDDDDEIYKRCLNCDDEINKRCLYSDDEEMNKADLETHNEDLDKRCLSSDHDEMNKADLDSHDEEMDISVSQPFQFDYHPSESMPSLDEGPISPRFICTPVGQ